MSLLTEAMTKCILLDKVSVNDGYGSPVFRYQDGEEVMIAFDEDNSLQARTASVEGVTALYTITTSRAVHLPFHQVFRRVADGSTFRVTSDGTDTRTPRSAALDMRNYSAERWEIPKDE